jgi:hypothetical protein
MMALKFGIGHVSLEPGHAKLGLSTNVLKFAFLLGMPRSNVNDPDTPLTFTIDAFSQINWFSWHRHPCTSSTQPCQQYHYMGASPRTEWVFDPTQHNPVPYHIAMLQGTQLHACPCFTE